MATKTMSKDEFIEAISSLNVLELAELVKALEEKFGVSAAAPVAVAAGPGAHAGGAAAPQEEVAATVSVILKEAGPNKINVIKALREVTTLGLKEAKDLVEGAPKPVKEGISKEEAATIKKKFEDVGAKVEVK